MDLKIKKAYQNPETGLKSYAEIRKQVTTPSHPVSIDDVKKALSGVDSYTLNKPATRNFARRQVIVAGIDAQFQADLVDMQRFTKDNDNIKYLLTVIDVFSKYAWAIPLKNKSGALVAEALDNIFKHRTPQRLQTDDGKEFFNVEVKNILSKYDIQLFSTNSELKAQIVERFNRTLKDKMFRYFDVSKTFRYIEVLDQLIKNYNNSYHRSIKRTPAQVNKSNESEVYNILYGSTSNPIISHATPKFAMNDFVRISKAEHIFRKGTEGNWTIQIYMIRSVTLSNPITYTLVDLRGEDIQGRFYEQELQKVQKPTHLPIEKILDRRTVKGEQQVLVKYLGYDAKFNEWIKYKNISN